MPDEVAPDDKWEDSLLRVRYPHWNGLARQVANSSSPCPYCTQRPRFVSLLAIGRNELRSSRSRLETRNHVSILNTHG